MRQVITNLIMVGEAVAFLALFLSILKYGSVLIQEPNMVILALEIAMMVGFIVFGLLNFYKQTGGKT